MGQRISRSGYFTHTELVRHSNPDLGGKNFQSLTKEKKSLKKKQNKNVNPAGHKKLSTIVGKSPFPAKF